MNHTVKRKTYSYISILHFHIKLYPLRSCNGLRREVARKKYAFRTIAGRLLLFGKECKDAKS